MNFTYKSGLIPIVVGITGHRDIPPSQVTTILDSIDKCLDKFDINYPNSPKILISGLAEGIDQIAAVLALKKGWGLYAALALPRNEFIQTFDQPNTENSVKTFNELISKATYVEEINVSNTPSPECYINVSHFIASKSQWLIACWDGKDSKIKDGGTSYTVKVFKDGIPSITPEVPDNGPITWINTHRNFSLNSNPPGETIDLAPTTSQVSIDAIQSVNDKKYLNIWEKIIKKIDQFNEKASLLLDEDFEKIDKKRKNYLQIKDALSASSEKASWLFAVSDELSMQSAKKRSMGVLGLVLGSVLALTCHAIYSDSPITHWSWQMASLLVALFTALTVVDLPVWLKNILPSFLVFNVKQIEDNYLDYRALAESCRVQYFWSVAGLKESASHYYLREQRDETEWIRQAVLNTQLFKIDEGYTLDSRKVEYILNAWILDQKKFFVNSKKSMHYHEYQEKRLGSISKYFFLIGISLTLISLIMQLFGIKDDQTQWIDFSYSIALIISAGVKLYQEPQGHPELSRSYQKMGLMMLLAQEKLSLYIDDTESLKHIIMKLGIACLNENAEWLQMHRSRPVSFVFGG